MSEGIVSENINEEKKTDTVLPEQSNADQLVEQSNAAQLVDQSKADQLVVQSAVDEPKITVSVENGNIIANISENGKTFEKCINNIESKITLDYDEKDGIKSITFDPPCICVKDNSKVSTTNENEGGYRKMKRRTRKNKKRRSKRKY